MRVGLMQEGHCPPGVPVAQRYGEMIHEAVLADQTGWDLYGNGEQHFGRYEATVSTPQINHAYIAALTERIRLRPMSVNLLPYNHPIRIAEDLVALDVLSGGRAELGGARSNNPVTLEAFGISPDKTRYYRDESLALIVKALGNDQFEHHTDMYDMPERGILRSVQKPAPPVHISATGVASHDGAGRMGIGAMTGNSILGWDYAQSCFDAYRAGVAVADPIGTFQLRRLAFSTVGVNCAPTLAEAKANAEPVALAFVAVCLQIYSTLSKQSPDYAYLGGIEKIRHRHTDLDYLIDCAPYLTIGTPDDFIAKGTAMHSMGADDILFRLDGMGHENNMAAIKLIGEEVIPALHELPEHPGSTPFGAVEPVPVAL